jgi:hypothetical protein
MARFSPAAIQKSIPLKSWWCHLKSGSFGAKVIPAKAGIQFVGRTVPVADGLDSRFPGNHCPWVINFLAKYTTTKNFHQAVPAV